MKAFALLLSLFIAPLLAGQARLFSLTPPSGPTSGGTVVTLMGEGFSYVCGPITCPPPTVFFGEVAATQTLIVSDTELRAIAPPHHPGTVDVHYEQQLGRTTLP